MKILFVLLFVLFIPLNACYLHSLIFTNLCSLKWHCDCIDNMIYTRNYKKHIRYTLATTRDLYNKLCYDCKYEMDDVCGPYYRFLERYTYMMDMPENPFNYFDWE